VRIANENMANAIRIVTVEQGIDPRDFAILAFGGAGPTHGAELADAIGIRRVIVPVNPGLTSAFGALAAQVRVDAVRSIALVAERTTGEELDRLLAELRGSYHVPPTKLPLDEMWRRIEQRRAGHRGRAGPGFAVRGARVSWWAGIAAALLVGVGIGRLTGRHAPAIGAREVVRSADREPRTPHDTVTYDQTTARYLGQTAALLTALPAEARAGQPDRRFVARAAELLTTTRLLLDSPAAADPKVRALLEDVELVLAQIAHLESDHGQRVEYELIAQALEQRDLLPRLHSAAAEGAGADD
jgi:hypothetical protein